MSEYQSVNNCVFDSKMPIYFLDMAYGFGNLSALDYNILFIGIIHCANRVSRLGKN